MSATRISAPGKEVAKQIRDELQSIDMSIAGMTEEEWHVGQM